MAVYLHTGRGVALPYVHFLAAYKCIISKALGFEGFT